MLFANKLDLSGNTTALKWMNSTCWDGAVHTSEKETGIKSQTCPSYLATAHVAVTAAVAGFMRREGRRDDYSDGITGLNSRVAPATATPWDVPEKSLISQDVQKLLKNAKVWAFMSRLVPDSFLIPLWLQTTFFCDLSCGYMANI